MNDFDFDKYWGVRLSDITFDNKGMAISFDVSWTEDSTQNRATLSFTGVSKCQFSAARIFKSEVVELISIEGKRFNGNWHVTGEFSNYEFEIVCAGVPENIA